MNPKECQEIDFSRQPILRFGKFDRIDAAKEIISEYSPISADALVDELSNRYGYREGMIRGNILPSISQFLHDGLYSMNFQMIPSERLDAFRGELTEDYYEFDKLKEIYTSLYPEADPRDINPRMLKTLGFVVNTNYAIQHYTSAEEYFQSVFSKNDVIDLAALRKKYSACYNTFSAYLYKKLQALDILYFEPNMLLNIRRLQKNGITREMLKDYCDSAIGLIEDGHIFTVDYLRKNGFSHPLDDLGFDVFFYNSLLSYDSRVVGNTMFGGIVLYKKGNLEQKLMRIDFIAYLMNGKKAIPISQLEKEAQSQYGVDIGTDHMT